MKVLNCILVTLAILLIATLTVNAQILPPPPPSGASVPLDPVSWLMLAVGGGYAIYKYRKPSEDE